MKEIQITRGMVALVDDQDYERVSATPWHARPVTVAKWIIYAERNLYCGKINGRERTRRISMHAFILGFPSSVIDHKDRNGLNNQRDNLRICTHRQNAMNRGKARHCSSIYKGVCWNRRNRKWFCCIKIHGKQISLGYFTSEVLAAAAYNDAALEAFGEFASLNELPPDYQI
jgi:hypothetical protein